VVDNLPHDVVCHLLDLTQKLEFNDEEKKIIKSLTLGEAQSRKRRRARKDRSAEKRERLAFLIS
jgi:uncharacterized membrane protein YheB (UPF0754 family)